MADGFTSAPTVAGDLKSGKPSHGGAAIQVTRIGGSGPVESSDGKTLYFTKGDGADGIWRMPLDGGQESQIVKA